MEGTIIGGKVGTFIGGKEGTIIGGKMGTIWGLLSEQMTRIPRVGLILLSPH